jgi:hypothetical protein
VETTEAKKYVNADLIAGQKYLTSSGAISSATISVDEAITAAEATALVDRYVNIWVDATHQERQKIVSAVAGAAGAATITLDAAPSGTGVTVADGTLVYANEYGFTGNDVHATMIFGEKSYAMIDISPKSGNMRILIKNKTEGGPSNPLEQFSTIGWKVEAMATAILQPLWIVKILHGVTA